ncbi:MAG: DNA polymerase III subunit delta [Lachnospira sp.]|nr:DNA polymerase III subunit delta [Lachnospira sp.]
MKIISDHIKTGEYKSVYLIHGEEAYLRKQYRDKLRVAIIDDDSMNYSYFEGEKLSVREIIDIGNTLPFFSDHRLIIIEDSGFLKSSNEELADYIRNMPDYLIIVMVETETDKRNKVYKAISEVGYVCEMKPQTTATLEKWITGMLKDEKKVIEKAAVERMLQKTGAGMDIIKSEMDKLITYCMDKDVITVADVEAVCTTQTTSHIFDMIAAIASKRQQQALNLYYDLLTLKEPPMRILYMLVRQFNGILQVQDEMSYGKGNADIAKAMGVAPFIVGKYMTQAKYFTREQLKQALADCADIEERVKNGRINDKMGVELMIIKYSTK